MFRFLDRVLQKARVSRSRESKRLPFSVCLDFRFITHAYDHGNPRQFWRNNSKLLFGWCRFVMPFIKCYRRSKQSISQSLCVHSLVFLQQTHGLIYFPIKSLPLTLFIFPFLRIQINNIYFPFVLHGIK